MSFLYINLMKFFHSRYVHPIAPTLYNTHQGKDSMQK